MKRAPLNPEYGKRHVVLKVRDGIYGSTDLFACIRPGQGPLDPQENISARD